MSNMFHVDIQNRFVAQPLLDIVLGENDELLLIFSTSPKLYFAFAISQIQHTFWALTLGAKIPHISTYRCPTEYSCCTRTKIMRPNNGGTMRFVHVHGGQRSECAYVSKNIPAKKVALFRWRMRTGVPEGLVRRWLASAADTSEKKLRFWVVSSTNTRKASETKTRLAVRHAEKAISLNKHGAQFGRQ